MVAALPGYLGRVRAALPCAGQLSSQPFLGQLSFPTASDEQLDRELRTARRHRRSAREDGVLLPKVSAAALCITESRPANLLLGLRGRARDSSEVYTTRGLGLKDLACERRLQAVPFCRALKAAPKQARLWLTLSRRRHHCKFTFPARTAQAGAHTTAAIAPRSQHKRNAPRAAARQARERDRRRGGRRRDRERHARARRNSQR